MPLTSGTRLGPYEIVAPLGAGGMGEVYRAHDTTLNRDVALKILPEAFASDPDRLMRFTREAQSLAALNHPNIAAIYGIEPGSRGPGVPDSSTTQALVMELVEGDDLSVRIARGAMPLDDALPIARQIADALEAAHEAGIVHRDLKPANIKVRHDGTVKVLDFGLAKGMDSGTSGPQDTNNSPTLTARATQIGMIIGTAAYMSPEQAKGRPVDKRADIWAFGVVLYEMLTGRRAFAPSMGEGDSIVEVLASVVKDDVSWEALPSDLPPSVRRLLRRCLEKDPKRRLSAIGDARLELDDAGMDGPRVAAGTERPSTSTRRREAIAWTAAGLLLLAVIAVWLTRPATGFSTPRVIRSTLQLPAGVSIELAGANAGMPVLAPDGRRIAFGAREGAGPMRIWVHDLASGTAKPLAGTEGGQRPFWKPDGTSIGYFTLGALSTIPADGGAVRRLADARDARGGTWSRNGTILFASYTRGPLVAVSELGGTVTTATDTAGNAETTHRFPQFLPDGEHFVYLDRRTARGPGEGSAVVVGRLGSPTPVARLLESATNAIYADGHLVYVQDGALVAQAFDPDALQLGGEPTVVATDLLFNQRFSYGVFSASGSGVLAFLTGRQRELAQLVWRDRAGRNLGTLGTPGNLSGTGGPALSPDGRWAAAIRIDEDASDADVWLYDLVRGRESRLARKGDENGAVFEAGSRALYFVAQDGGTSQIVRRDLERGVEAPIFKAPFQLRHDAAPVGGGTSLLYSRYLADASLDILLRPLSGDGDARVLVGTKADDAYPQVSPDGRWLSWASDESGRYEVYVAPFPEVGTSPVRVSRDGGTQPRWNPKGGELFFKTLENMLTVVPVEASSRTFSVGPPVALFPIVDHIGWTYDVSADGTRFLVREPLGERDASPVTILTDWVSLVKRR